MKWKNKTTNKEEFKTTFSDSVRVQRPEKYWSNL